MRSSAWLLLTLALVEAAGFAPLAAQATPSQCWSAAASLEVHTVGESCVPILADSLRSSAPENSARARMALERIGGRAAVDALRADHERAPTFQSRRAVIRAMGTTGSPEDVAFLVTQLRGQFPSGSGDWFEVHMAATMLGLLRATAARDSLQAALARNNNPNTYTNRAITTALASLDRPPCADSVAGDIERELIRIVVQCRPQPMWTTSSYRDSLAGGVWTFERDAWQFNHGAPTDTTIPRVTMRAMIAPDGRHAEVHVFTLCGRRCGEFWPFRLVRTGDVWRVVSAVMAGAS
jgi:hypothetical protein